MQPVVVTFDANKVNAPGTYKASATVNSNDPQNQAIDVQTTMVVTAPANWGVLQGTISSLGYCDANPAPLSGATVLVTGSNGMTRTATTGANGSYEFWLPDYGSPYTVLATEADHLPATCRRYRRDRPGHHHAGPEPALGAALRHRDAACAERHRRVAGNLRPRQMVLSNTGAAATPFTITEMPGTFTPMGVNGNQILIVNDGGSNTYPTNAFKTAMDNLGYTYDVVSSSSSTGIPADMFDYIGGSLRRRAEHRRRAEPADGLSGWRRAPGDRRQRLRLL